MVTMASKSKKSSTAEATPARIKAAGAMLSDPAQRAALGTPSHIHSTSSASLAGMAASRAAAPTRRSTRSAIRDAPTYNSHFSSGVRTPEK